MYFLFAFYLKEIINILVNEISFSALIKKL